MSGALKHDALRELARRAPDKLALDDDGGRARAQLC